MEPRPAAAALAALCVALAAWSGAILRGGFAYDDREAIEGNPVVEGTLPWHAAFERDYWHHREDAGHYRPLATLALRVDRAVYGQGTRGFHATNALLHGAVAALLAAASVALVRRKRAALLGALAFACHPVLADSVAWVSGRTSMLSCLGGALALLGAVHAARRRSAALAALAASGVLLGLLAKEDAVVFCLPLLLIAASGGRRVLVGACCGLALAALAYLALRAHALGSPWPSAPHAPLRERSLGVRLAYGGAALSELGRVLVLPFQHTPNYRAAFALGSGDVPRWAALAWLPWLALVACGARALVRRPVRVAPVAGALAALALLPVLQLVPSGELFAPRFAYVFLLLAAPLVGVGLARLPERALQALLLLAVAGAFVRSEVYSSRAAYAEAILRHVPNDAGAWNDLGLARDEDGDTDGARAAWEHALELQPGYSRARVNLGLLELEAGDLDSAELELERAVRAGPDNPVAHANLGGLLLRRARPVDAEGRYRRALELAPGFAPAWRGLGNALARQGRDLEARAALERALALSPGDALATRLLERLAD